MATNIGTTVSRATRHSEFTRKQIEITFNVKNPDGTTDTVEIVDDHRIHALISTTGMLAGAQLRADIYGLPLVIMNRLSNVAGFTTINNTSTINLSSTEVIVKFGTHGQELLTVFVGTILEAFADFSQSPDVPFRVTANALNVISKTTPVSVHYKGTQKVNRILQDLCTRSGGVFVDHGGWGNTTLTNQFVYGSFLDQVAKIMKNVRGVFNFEPSISGHAELGTLHAWGSQYTGNTNKLTPVISKKTGLIGYPEYQAHGIKLTSLFRPDLGYYTPFTVKSNYLPSGWIPNAQGLNQANQQIGQVDAPWDGTWLPNFIQHDLSSESPNAPSFTHLEATRALISRNYVAPK